MEGECDKEYREELKILCGDETEDVVLNERNIKGQVSTLDRMDCFDMF